MNTSTGDPTSAYAAAARLDAALGDPAEPGSPFGFAAALERDETEAFPERFAAALHSAGLPLACVPVGSGGRLRSMDDTLMLLRVAARRDPAVVPAVIASVSAVTGVLADGSAAQRRRVVDIVAAGGTVGFALAEPSHGSDLLANECLIAAGSDPPDGRTGYRVDGHKWMVTLGDRCTALYLVGRTSQRGPHAFSAVLLDRAHLPDDSPAEPSFRPTGMRGIGLSGFTLHGLPVPADALVGTDGGGLDSALKGIQVARVLGVASHLGAADTALRVAVDFARGHIVRDRPLVEQPLVRRDLAFAFTALAVCDVVSLAAARVLHVAPPLAGLWSAVAKRVAGELCRELIDRCGDVLGARAVSRDGPVATYQKVRRDNDVARFADTGPLPNLRLVAAQLPVIPDPAGADGSGTALTPVFDLAAPLPEFDPAALELTALGRPDVTQTLVGLAGAVRNVPGIASLASRLAAELRRLHAEATDRQQAGGPAAPVLLYDLADRFCFLHAATSCLQLWWHNQGVPLFGAPAGSTAWLAACLEFLLDRAGGVVHRGRYPAVEDQARLLLDLHERGRLFSAVPVTLAHPGTPPHFRSAPKRSSRSGPAVP